MGIVMKTFTNVLALLLLTVAPAPVYSQTHAELHAMVQQLQANPSDTALRERIIQVARALKPAPAIPEAARESFVQGTTIAQSAKDAAGQALAVQRFEQAIRIAPWWGDAWYNLAVAQELAGQLDAARRSLQLYILTGLDAEEARKAQDRIYALEAKNELASTEAANVAARKRADADALWNARWVSYHASGSSSRLSSKKVGDIVEFYPEGWTAPLYRGRFESNGGIRWQYHVADQCGWVPMDMNVAPDLGTLTTWEQTTDLSTCRSYGERSLRTIRRE